jgi:hypothetical protein
MMEMVVANLNLRNDVAECIVLKTSLTGSDAYNICNNTIYHVPHGLVDMIIGYSVATFSAVMVALIIFMIVNIIRD